MGYAWQNVCVCECVCVSVCVWRSAVTTHDWVCALTRAWLFGVAVRVQVWHPVDPRSSPGGVTTSLLCECVCVCVFSSGGRALRGSYFINMCESFVNTAFCSYVYYIHFLNHFLMCTCSIHFLGALLRQLRIVQSHVVESPIQAIQSIPGQFITNSVFNFWSCVDIVLAKVKK